MSFGGGDSPSNTSFNTQYTRDAPQIEASKMGLMGTAKDYTRFGMNPWEASTPGAKPGEAGFDEYKYTGTDGRYAVDTKFGDLTREQRAREGQAGGAAGIPTQQVAAFNPQQQQAFNLASQGIGAYQPLLDQSKQFTQQSTQQYDPQSYQQYMNPYQDEVISGIEQQFGKAGAGMDLQAAKSGSFGGARQGIQSAELAGQQAQAVGQAQAQNYGQAQQQAQQQFLDAQYQQQLQQLYEPYQRLGFTSDIYQGMPSSAMAISMGTSPGSNPLAQTVGAGIAGLGAYQGYKNVTGG